MIVFQSQLIKINYYDHYIYNASVIKVLTGLSQCNSDQACMQISTPQPFGKNII